jgi:hypothetical protein
MSIQVTPIPRLTVLTDPAFTLGTANAAGSALTAVASDSTLLAFDTTAPDAITFGQSGVVGVATVTSRRDHAHAMASIDVATQAEMEAASSVTVFDTPGRTQYHPGVAKAWCNITADGALSTPSHNIASISDDGVGDRTIHWAIDFSTAIYSVVSAPAQGVTANRNWHDFRTFATGSVQNRVLDSAVGAGLGAVDAAVNVAAFGDQ